MAENKNEVMSMDELDHVAGGSYIELEKDMRFLSAMGLLNKSRIPAGGVNESNFDEVNKLVYETWAKSGVIMNANEAGLNSYTLPAGAESYSNNRMGALAYVAYINGRGDVHPENYR